MKVENMKSDNDNSITNQYIITDTEKEVFQSHSFVIVEKHYSGKVLLDEKYWNYNKTTSKYRNKFLDETTTEIQRKIDNGIYELKDLNP